MNIPKEIVTLIGVFAPVFSDRVWVHAQVLLVGAILSGGPRTVTAALRVMGLSAEKNWSKYHRVLSRARWSALAASRILLWLIVTVLVAAGAPTFSDLIALVRRHLWSHRYFNKSAPSPDDALIPKPALDLLLDQLCYAA